MVAAAVTGSPPTGRVVRMVSFLAAHPDRSFSLSELARAAEITTATCHAILVSLVEAGWVTRTDLTYGLGPAMLAIGRAAAAGYSMARAAASELAGLAAATGFTAGVSVLDGESVVLVDAVGAGAAELIGRRVPYVPPIGIVFAAFDSAGCDDWLNRLPGTGDGRIGDRDELRRALDLISRRGYVIERFTPAATKLRDVLADIAGSPSSADGPLQDAVLSLLARLGPAEHFPVAPEGDETTEVTVLGVPVRGADGHVDAHLWLHPGREMSGAQIAAAVDLLSSAAARTAASSSIEKGRAS
ncbi:IclR family transcriptional regulator [Nocardia tengchongensis]|uniref:IclR family transcriptional regulator n=1 Tax=Nocardia tengchongensis TaxID=2055889 RepID=UPI0036B71F39